MMSARVLNPAATMMSEMSRSLGVLAGNASSPVTSGSGRAQPSRAALAKVRRDLFGPVDHAAARALAESELRAQSILDAERWGFDFRLEVPKPGASSRFEWEIISSEESVPEPYAFRGMPYLRRHAPSSPRKSLSPRFGPAARRQLETTLASPTPMKELAGHFDGLDSERTPPQESRLLAAVSQTTPEIVSNIAELSFRSKEKSRNKQSTPSAQHTPVQTRKQASITDFLKSRKRTLNGTSKSVIEPPAKVSRKAGQIHS